MYSISSFFKSEIRGKIWKILKNFEKKKFRLRKKKFRLRNRYRYQWFRPILSADTEFRSDTTVIGQPAMALIWQSSSSVFKSCRLLNWSKERKEAVGLPINFSFRRPWKWYFQISVARSSRECCIQNIHKRQEFDNNRGRHYGHSSHYSNWLIPPPI